MANGRQKAQENLEDFNSKNVSATKLALKFIINIECLNL